MAKSAQVLVVPSSTGSTVASALVAGGPRVTLSVPASFGAGVYLGGEENVATGDPALLSGGAALSTSNGFLLEPGKSVSLNLEGSEVVRAITASSTVSVTVNVFRTRARYA